MNNYQLKNYNCDNLGEILGFTDNAGERWLSAKQIGKWLEITNVRMTLHFVDEDNQKYIEKSNFSNVNNVYVRNLANRGETFVNYEGFLEISFKSRTPRAKQVKKFIARVFKEVIETGSFSIKQNNQLSTSDILKIATDEIKRLELENKQQALQIENQEQVIEENNNKFYNNDLSYGISVGEMASMFVNERTGEQLGRNKLYEILVKIGLLRRIEKQQKFTTIYEYRLTASSSLNKVFSENVIPRINTKNGFVITVQTFLPPAFDAIAKILDNEYGYVLKARIRSSKRNFNNLRSKITKQQKCEIIAKLISSTEAGKTITQSCKELVGEYPLTLEGIKTIWRRFRERGGLI